MDNETPRPRQNGDGFTALQLYYLKDWAPIWQSLGDDARKAFVVEYAWLQDLHVAKDKQDVQDRDRKTNRKWLVGLAIPVAIALFSALQYFIVSTAASSRTQAPTSITVKLPSGQTFVVTPAPTPTASEGTIQP